MDSLTGDDCLVDVDFQPVASKKKARQPGSLNPPVRVESDEDEPCEACNVNTLCVIA